jgi:hypothetical protein
MYQIVNNVWSYFTKTIYFLYKSYRQKYVATPICNFLTKFEYYYDYHVVIWKNKFELSLENIWIFLSIFRVWVMMEHVSLKINFKKNLKSF